jgi:ADP-ribose pyrophosphatase YjhB (NUDIX family)
MLDILTGDRVGKDGTLNAGSNAVIFDKSLNKVFLIRRNDNGMWSLPGGQMQPGESASECCVREVREETHLTVQVLRLIGIYTSPDYLLVYERGDRVQPLTFCFEAEIISGEFAATSESGEAGYFSQNEIGAMNVLPINVDCIHDAFARQTAAFIR